MNELDGEFMHLISIQGWSNLLYMMIEPNGQPWMAVSTVLAPSPCDLTPYSVKKFLGDWSPMLEIRQ